MEKAQCNFVNKKLFLTNTAFKKASRHITTWVGSWRDKDNKLMPIYNQIDLIICKQNQKHTIKDAQSYSGTTLSSEHKLVKTTFRLSNVNTWREIKRKPVNVNVKKKQVTTELRHGHCKQLFGTVT